MGPRIAIAARPDVELQIIACASALLERYGNVSQVIKAQGYPIAAEVWSTIEGATSRARALGRDGTVRVLEYHCSAAKGEPPRVEEFGGPSLSISCLSSLCTPR